MTRSQGVETFLWDGLCFTETVPNFSGTLNNTGWQKLYAGMKFVYSVVLFWDMANI